MADLFDPDMASFINVDGLAIRVVRDGQDCGNLPVLLTSPYPETVAAFHAIWPQLRDFGRLIAVDLPGFGRSEGRRDLMSPIAMGAFFPRLMDALGLDRVHAVVPDVGTLAALFAAVDHPQRFESIVAGSGGAAMDLLGDSLRQIVESSHDDYAGADGGEQVVALIRQMARITPPKSVIEDYRRGSAGSRWNDAADFVRAYPRDLPRLAEPLPSIKVPVLILSGRDDPLVPPSNGDFLRDGLPRAVAEVLDAGHFVWEDAPERYGALVRAWIDGGYRRAGAAAR